MKFRLFRRSRNHMKDMPENMTVRKVTDMLYRRASELVGKGRSDIE